MRNNTMIVWLWALMLLLSVAVPVWAEDDLALHPDCKVCGMDRENHAHTRIFVEFDDGSSMGSCSIHCAAAQLSTTLDKIPKRIMVGEYKTGNLIDATTAFWVIGGKKPAVMTKVPKWAFATEAAAEAFIRENGGTLANYEQALQSSYEQMNADTQMIRERKRLKRLQSLKHQAAARYAYVTSEGDNTVTVIDLLTEKTVKVLPTGKIPHAIAFTQDGKGYVNNRGSSDLTVFNAASFELITTIQLPAVSFQVATSPDGKLLAVAYKERQMVTLIDTATNTIVSTVEIGTKPAGAKGIAMRHPYWSPDSRFVYVADNFNSTLVKVDAQARKIAKVIAMPGGSHYLHPAENGRLIYAGGETAKGGGLSVTIVDPATDTVIKDIQIPLQSGEPGLGHHGDFTPDGKFFFFANEGGKTIGVIDAIRRELVGTIQVGMGAGHPMLSKDGKYFFIVHHKDNIISVIDNAVRKVVATIPVGIGKKQAHSSYFTPDGRFFYMVNAADNLIYKIDVATRSVASTIPVGKSAMFFGLREGNRYVATE